MMQPEWLSPSSSANLLRDLALDLIWISICQYVNGTVVDRSNMIHILGPAPM